ncbi:uncharacterized protein, partial [Prorops nasuta]|uniref:uncharacterized protein n=1 Tax=Prorops nasuta TaxID=863751 RepID=UPI0034CD97E9
RAGPLGNGQRRPSRSPRSQRSRSADVDCLKKYTERRVEERRHTEAGDGSRLDPSRWVPLPKSITRIQGKKVIPVLKDAKRHNTSGEGSSKVVDSYKWLPGEPRRTLKRSENVEESMEEKQESKYTLTGKQTAVRSRSTDVTSGSYSEQPPEGRNRTGSDTRLISSSWIPSVNTSRFRYEASPLARATNTCESTRSAATRWITFNRNPSPSPLRRKSLERKPSIDENRKSESSSQEEKWHPLRKFSRPPSPKKDNNSLQKGSKDSRVLQRSPDNDGTNRLTQRMRELYDFKTENEWPQRINKPSVDFTWISKSSSEDERYVPIRRNSQDLEFNERTGKTKTLRSRHQEMLENERCQGQSVKKCNNDGEVFFEADERLRRFNERLRFSEDLGSQEVRVRERRTYSDDYDDIRGRSSRRDTEETLRSFDVSREKKRISDASSKSRTSGTCSYAEVGFLKNPRSSDATYVSIGNYSKRASLECQSSKEIYHSQPRRAFSHNEERRPSTPLPPIELNNPAPIAIKLLPQNQKRDSTRYKVYLT